MKSLVKVLLLIITLSMISCQKNGSGGGNNSDTTPSNIILYSAGVTNANFGGRNGADTLCETDKPAGIDQTKVRAFISVNASDEIRDMPSNYSISTDVIIESSNNTKIAENWADLIDNSILVSLQSIGIGSTHIEWWSGSNSGGSLATFHCSNWTSDMMMSNGMSGQTDSATAFLDGGLNDPCASTRHLICLAFD